MLLDMSHEPRANPLDEVERIATSNEWLFERAREHEITMIVRGSLTDHQVSVTWMRDIEALHLACEQDGEMEKAATSAVAVATQVT